MDSPILEQVLGNVVGSPTNLYTVPIRAAVAHDLVEVSPSAVVRNTVATVNSIIVCAQAASAYTIWLVPEDDTRTADNLIFDAIPIGANDTDVIHLGLVLPAGTEIDVSCTVLNDISFTLNGIETT